MALFPVDGPVSYQDAGGLPPFTGLFSGNWLVGSELRLALERLRPEAAVGFPATGTGRTATRSAVRVVWR